MLILKTLLPSGFIVLLSIQSTLPVNFEHLPVSLSVTLTLHLTSGFMGACPHQLERQKLTNLVTLACPKLKATLVTVAFFSTNKFDQLTLNVATILSI